VNNKFAGTVGFARDSYILSVAEIRPDLKLMISKRACHVTDPLKLVLLLIQRAVALVAHIVSVQGVSEKKASGTVQKESWHAGSVIAVEVQARKTRVLGRRGAEPVGIHEHPIAEKAETEISDPVRCRRIIHTISQALIT